MEKLYVYLSCIILNKFHILYCANYFRWLKFCRTSTLTLMIPSNGTDFTKFLYRNSKNASIQTSIDVQFSFRIGKSISVIISPRNICYLLNNCKTKFSEMRHLTRLVVLALVPRFLVEISIFL